MTTLVRSYSAKNEVLIEQQGSLLGLAMRSDASPRQGGGRRGNVTEFSRGSRRRLLRQIARLEPTRTTFVTLTYPAQFPDVLTSKRHLRALLERFRYHYPKASAIWRMELQTRGAPHFHLLFFNLPYLKFETLREWWRQIINEREETVLFVRIEIVRSWRGVMSYAAKYLSKVSASASASSLLDNVTYPQEMGRWWGVHNRPALPLSAKVFLAIRVETTRGFHDAKKLMRRYYPALTNQRWKGGVLLTARAPALWSVIVRILINDISDCWFDPDIIQIVR